MSTPTPAPDDILQGVCDDSNVYFWSYFGGSVFLSILIMYCRFRLVTPPKYSGPGNAVDFGRPYGIAILLYHICMWNLAPQVAFFVIFHVAMFLYKGDVCLTRTNSNRS
ncbi:transmembrane protein, putative [Bodo saltans]|uniref:Transmembrane protein, putative n=1 Tax=Bodo saltans TaxID=75058 RepID=A0A0S4KII3_BODSA|nr:transmembrane protein, putative [Bodo saltans]|eukprot:CUI14250.1 transmembrane protein, putative [Bodo saltans]